MREQLNTLLSDQKAAAVSGVEGNIFSALRNFADRWMGGPESAGLHVELRCCHSLQVNVNVLETSGK